MPLIITYVLFHVLLGTVPGSVVIGCGDYEYYDPAIEQDCVKCEEADFCNTRIHFNLHMCEEYCNKYYTEILKIPQTTYTPPNKVPVSPDDDDVSSSTLNEPFTGSTGDDATSSPRDFSGITTAVKLPDWGIVLIVCFGAILLAIIVGVLIKCRKKLFCRRQDEDNRDLEVNSVQIALEHTLDPGRLTTAHSESESGIETMSESEHSSMI